MPRRARIPHSHFILVLRFRTWAQAAPLPCSQPFIHTGLRGDQRVKNLYVFITQVLTQLKFCGKIGAVWRRLKKLKYFHFFLDFS